MRATVSQLNFNHVYDGGTMITNFGIESQLRYALAIMLFEVAHGPSSLVLSSDAYAHGKKLNDVGSLHSTSGSHPLNIQQFWNIFKNVNSDLIAKYSATSVDN